MALNAFHQTGFIHWFLEVMTELFLTRIRKHYGLMTCSDDWTTFNLPTKRLKRYCNTFYKGTVPAKGILRTLYP